MLEESESRPKLQSDPSMNCLRPTSQISQDISHVLTSIFKDLYTSETTGKDTLSSLTKTRSGRSDYHDRYVEELQQAHAEYNRRIKEADMLEDHIIQARVQATATETQAYERIIEEMGEAEDALALQPVKSNPARPTFSYNMHVSKEPRDDGYTLIPSPEKTIQNLTEGSECSLTLESSSDSKTKMKKKKKIPSEVHPRPKWMGEPSAEDREEGKNKLQRMKERQSFLCNPRFLPPSAPQGGKSLIWPRSKVEKTAQGRKMLEEQSSTDEPIPVFVANPSVIFFTGYTAGHVYETTLELKNLTAVSRHVRVIPPTTPYFSIGLGRFPGEGSVVAPGMSCKYTVRFAPDSLADYKDFVMVETQAQQPLLVPIEARRPPPILTLPRVLECGYCLIGGVKFVEFLCHNHGLSTGTFCIIPKNKWPTSNLRSVVTTYFTEQPPFAVSPSLFVLQPGQATVVEVAFFPTAAERFSQVFTIICNNCQVKDIVVQGEGQSIALELVSVSGVKDPPAIGEMHDLTAEHFVRFGSINPYSVQQKKLVIRNTAHLELPFHWQIMKPNLQPLLPGEAPDPSHIQFHLATDDVFHVSPLTGLLAPCQDQEFLFTFCPNELKDYHSVCHLVLRDIPQLPAESSENGASQPLSAASKLNDVIVMEIEVKGSTEPYQILLEPYAIHIPGELFIGTTARNKFKMWNHSKSCIFFQWERISSCHIIEVEPSTGELEVNECFDFDLVVTGGKPGRVVTSLSCHVEHHNKPVTLAVEVSFKGPKVTLSVPSLDLGLLSLGEQTQTTVLLTNTSQLEACWMLEERSNSQQDQHLPQILVEPCRGVLPPLASCSVDVLFRAHSCQHFDTVLELSVENGTGCHVSVQADVQAPQVCLLSCELVFSEIYMGVPAKGVVTLFNQTLLPAHFTWMAQLQGKQASLCTASFDPSSGTLGPNASMEITVSFTSHTDLELTEVAALCEVQGMKSPVVLGFYSKAKKLSVSYSLPSVCSASDDQNCSSMVIDFGDDVILKRAVTRQLLIANLTAILAPFTVEVEYFTSHTPSASKPNNQSQKRFTYMKKPLHSVQAKKIEERAHEEFVSSLLAHGKGAAFFVVPDSGMLGPFESQTISITAYADMWGEYRDHLICKVGDLAPRLIPMQMTVKGCPLYFPTMGPRPHDQNQAPTVQFGTHLSGGDTVSRSLRINNTSPYDIRVDWESYNIDENDKKLLDVVVAYGDAFPLKDADGNEVPGGALRLSDENIQPAWDRSHTPSSEGTCSSLQSKNDADGEESTTEEENADEETSLYPFHPQKKLFNVHIRPHIGNLSDYPYCITPQQIVIPAKGSSTVHVSFTPLTLSGPVCETRCVGLALGFMSLDSKMAACVPGKVRRPQALDLEPVRIDLQAVVKPAVLSVQMEEDEGVLEFHASASDLQRGDSEKGLLVQDFDVTQTFQLKNTLEMPLHFRLAAQPPFFVLHPQPRARTSSSSNPPTSDSQPLVIQAQQSMQVKVAFCCSLSLLDHVGQAEQEVPPAVTLVHGASGQQKLKFKQNLLIHYSNNTLQRVPLCAHLDLASLCLSTDSIDFGTCYVGQTQIAEVSLHSCGAHSYWRTVIESDDRDSHVFRVTPDCGLPGSQGHPNTRCRQPLQISFTASEEREFTATVIVQAVLVKTPLTLQLQGRGSLCEVHRSSQVSS
ncbi:deleted in lung and esophageal cancer protein 1 [Myripristis murdjan]|uniref:deleted in lung and esophageal cancer protein 1 n=1 Tax=Myripristis murdjan TaxID=586833 RepID=UPI0011764984|nr:deleted in lung and esophageal cancer protein 1 [Myripristis murdjan]